MILQRNRSRQDEARCKGWSLCDQVRAGALRVIGLLRDSTLAHLQML